MNRTELTQLKEHVSRRIATLETLLFESGGARRHDSDQDDDEAAKMDQTLSAEVASRISQAERTELVRLKNNLTWLESDDAGYCDGCGKPIPFARLMAVPVTRQCIECAQC